jgi:hypothetical protein
MSPQTAQLVSSVFEWWTAVTTVASVLHSALPPVSAFDGYPRIQGTYKIIVLFIGVVAINWRGQVQNQPSQPVGVVTQNAVPTTETSTHV